MPAGRKRVEFVSKETGLVEEVSTIAGKISETSGDDKIRTIVLVERIKEYIRKGIGLDSSDLEMKIRRQFYPPLSLVYFYLKKNYNSIEE